MSTFKSTPDADGDFLDFTSNIVETAPHIVVIGVGGEDDNYLLVALSRDDAAALATHLTDAVEAADTREARKLKRGEFVHSRLGTGYTVVSDETDDGLVDLVGHLFHSLYVREMARNFTRTPAGR